jgi:hypothetical protein
MGSVLFPVPGVADINGRISVPWFASGTGDYADVTELSARLLLLQMTPLLRGLQILGWETIDLVVAEQDRAPDEFLRLELDSMRIEVVHPDTRLADLWSDNADSELLVTLRLRPREGLAISGLVLGRPLPAALGATDVTASLDANLVWALPSSSQVRSVGKQLAPHIDDAVEAVRAALVAAWPSGRPPDPEQDGGLLWLYNPDHWEHVSVHDASTMELHAVGTDALAAIQADPAGFLNDQVDARRSIVQLLAEGPARRSDAKNLVRHLVDAVDDLTRRRWLGGQMSQLISSRLPGMCWTDVLWQLLESGLFQPGHLPGGLGITILPPAPANPVDYASFEDIDGPGVELTVHGHGPLSLQLKKAIAAEMLGLAPTEITHDHVPLFVSWEYVAASTDRPACLIVVAAPGLAVLRTGELPPGTELHLYRVQDPAIVPTWGSHINTGLYESGYTFGRRYRNDPGPGEALLAATSPDDDLPPPADLDPPTSDPDDPVGAHWTDAGVEPEAAVPYPSAFLIKQRPTGITILHPAADTIRDPSTISGAVADYLLDFSGLHTNVGDYYRLDIDVPTDPGNARFAVYLQEKYIPDSARIHSEQPYTVRLRLKGDVRVQRTIANGVDSFITEDFQTVGSYGDVPSHGAAIEFSNHYEGLPYTVPGDADDVVTFMILTTAADVGIGFIPIVGDAADAAELVASFATGTDKWGNPVTNFDRILMGAGMVLPFVSGRVLRGMKSAAGVAIEAAD